MASLSTSAYYQQSSGYHAAQLAVDDAAFNLMAHERARKLQSLIATKDNVLEYGVGTGLDLASLHCATRAGFDIGAHLAAELESRGIRFHSSTESIEDNSFDTVICHHALEHVAEPAAALIEILRLLRPQGRLLLFVPYEREARYRQFRPDEPNHHLYSWNPQTLGNLVSACGFLVDHCGLGMYGYERFTARLVSRAKAGTLAYRALLRLLRTIRPVAEIRLIARKGDAR